VLKLMGLGRWLDKDLGERKWISLSFVLVENDMKALLILLVFFVSGCAAVITPDYSYFRLGDQQIQGLSIKKGETQIELNRQESQTELLKTLIELGAVRIP